MLNVIPITDFSSSELDVYARLTENDLLSKHEPEKGIFIAESPNVIERALNAGYEAISFLIETDELARTPFYIADAAKKLGGKVTFVDAIHYTKGEGIEKKVDDFAAEVASMIK